MKQKKVLMLKKQHLQLYHQQVLQSLRLKVHKSKKVSLITKRIISILIFILATEINTEASTLSSTTGQSTTEGVETGNEEQILVFLFSLINYSGI